MNFKKVCWYIKLQLFKFMFASVGSKSYMGSPLFIQHKKNVYIGSNVRIYPGMRVETPNKDSHIVIGDDISIGQNFHVVCYDDDLIIGNGTTISGNVFISNVNHGYQKIGVPALKQNLIKRKTKIGKNCFIGYGAVLLPGTILGDNCIVGANAVVKGKFSNNCVLAGVPAKIIKKYNSSTKKWELYE